MAHIAQKTLGATFRIDYNITPEISLQYYGSPFASVGKYSAFKEITKPHAANYADRFSLLSTTLAQVRNIRLQPIAKRPPPRSRIRTSLSPSSDLIWYSGGNTAQVHKYLWYGEMNAQPLKMTVI